MVAAAAEQAKVDQDSPVSERSSADNSEDRSEVVMRHEHIKANDDGCGAAATAALQQATNTPTQQQEAQQTQATASSTAIP